METVTDAKPRSSEAIWLAAAHDVLTESGVEAVKIMPLAKRLGLSRTSFYWHFKDREALLEAMVRRWEDKNTGTLVARTQAYADSIVEALFNIFDCWLDDTLFDARLDLAIRNWARTDADLKKRLDAADDRRREAFIALFRRFGFGKAEAEVRAMTMIYTQIGYISMQVNEDLAPRIARMPLYIEVMTGQAPRPSDIERFTSRHAHRL